MFTETASGARADRPTLTQVLDQLRPGDTLVVWKLDRLGRWLRHLVDTVTGLADRGIGFRSLQEAIDTTTPGGKLVFHVFAALAEFEPDLIREAHGWAGRGPGPGSPWRPAGVRRSQAAGGPDIYRSGSTPSQRLPTRSGAAGPRSIGTSPALIAGSVRSALRGWRRSESEQTSRFVE